MTASSLYVLCIQACLKLHSMHMTRKRIVTVDVAKSRGFPKLSKALKLCCPAKLDVLSVSKSVISFVKLAGLQQSMEHLFYNQVQFCCVGCYVCEAQVLSAWYYKYLIFLLLGKRTIKHKVFLVQRLLQHFTAHIIYRKIWVRTSKALQQWIVTLHD